MAELLTHVLAGYIIGMLLSIRYDWVRAPQVTLVMIGAATPDLNRLRILVHETTVEATLGVPFSWDALHYLGGNLVVLCIAALVIAPQWRRRAFALLLVGALSHHVLDLLLLSVTGHTYPVFWPLTDYHPPAGMLYRSTDQWPVVVAAVGAAAVWLAHHRDQLAARWDRSSN